MSSKKNLFDANVEHVGFLSPSDIKLLVCYILKSIGKPIEKDIVISSITTHELANYYTVCEAITSLISLGNIEEYENLLSITAKGSEAAGQLEISLPYSVREKVIYATMDTLLNIKSKNENNVKVEKTDNGYLVSTTINDGDIKLFSLCVYAPDSMQADFIKEKFLRNIKNIYMANIEMLF